MVNRRDIFISASFALLVSESIGLIFASYEAEAKGLGASAHNAGEIFLETKDFQLFSNTKYGDWCFNQSDRDQANVSLVLKVDANYTITDNAEYQRRFENIILPEILKRCRSVTSVHVSNYIHGIRIDNSDSEEYRYDQRIPTREKPLNAIFVWLDQKGGFHYRKVADGTGQPSLTAFRKQRDAWKAAAAKRQTNQEAATDRRAHQKEEKRRRIAESESKGGVEPTSDELAVAYTKASKLGLPTCPNLANKEWCQWSIDVWVRLKGGKKVFCKSKTIGHDYECKYLVSYECLFRDPRTNQASNNPIVVGLYCLFWLMPKDVVTSVRRISGEWNAYHTTVNNNNQTPTSKPKSKSVTEVECARQRDLKYCYYDDLNDRNYCSGWLDPCDGTQTGWCDGKTGRYYNNVKQAIDHVCKRN